MWEKRPFWYSVQTQINTLGWKSWRSHVRWSLYLSALWFRGSFIIKLRATGDVIESVHIQLSCEIPFCAGWKDTSSCNREVSVHQLNFCAHSEWILCQQLTNRQLYSHISQCCAVTFAFKCSFSSMFKPNFTAGMICQMWRLLHLQNKREYLTTSFNNMWDSSLSYSYK